MADRVKNSKELNIVVSFVDGDDRTISIPTAKMKIPVSPVNTFAKKAANVIEGDKSAAAFKSVKSAKIFETTIYIDLTA